MACAESLFDAFHGMVRADAHKYPVQSHTVAIGYEVEFFSTHDSGSAQVDQKTALALISPVRELGRAKRLQVPWIRDEAEVGRNRVLTNAAWVIGDFQKDMVGVSNKALVEFEFETETRMVSCRNAPT